MGVIQNAINQMLGTVNFAAKLSPGYETRQELHKLSKQKENLKTRGTAVVESLRTEQANITAAQKAETKLKQRANYKSFKKALYANPDIAPLGEKAKQAIYNQTKGDKAFKEEVINKYYGNK